MFEKSAAASLETNEVDCVEMVTERGRDLCGGDGPGEY